MSAIPSSGAKRRLIVGISGASGVIYGVSLLALLRKCGLKPTW